MTKQKNKATFTTKVTTRLLLWTFIAWVLRFDLEQTNIELVTKKDD